MGLAGRAEYITDRVTPRYRPARFAYDRSAV